MSVWIVTGVLQRNQLTSSGKYRSFGGDFVVFQLKVVERKENYLIFFFVKRELESARVQNIILLEY